MEDIGLFPKRRGRKPKDKPIMKKELIKKKKCCECGNTFVIPNECMDWGWRYVGSETIIFCTYRCMRAYDAKRKENDRQIRRMRDLEEEEKVKKYKKMYKEKKKASASAEKARDPNADETETSPAKPLDRKYLYLAEMLKAAEARRCE